MNRRNSFNIGGIVIYLFCCVAIGVVIFFISEQFDNPSAQDTQIAQVLSSEQVKGTEIQISPTPPPSHQAAPLEAAVMKALEGTTGNYAVAIKNLKTGEQFYLNEHKSYDSGSLYKLWVMGETYRKVDTGELMLEDSMSASIPELNRIFEIDPDNAELTEGGITMTVSQALNQMITISHNYAALLLTQKNKLSTVKSWLENNGFKESSVGGDPKTTAADSLAFFDKLQSGQLGSPENTQKMLELLKNQKLNKKLPANLPQNITVAHKTGELGMFTHDAGIVYTPKGDYIIAVLSESEIPSAAEERIADISKAVYDYFQK